MKPKHLGLPARIRVIRNDVPCHRKPGRPVDVGEEFRSIAWAECSTGIHRTHIVGQLSGRVKHARGIVFEYMEENQ